MGDDAVIAQFKQFDKGASGMIGRACLAGVLKDILPAHWNDTSIDGLLAGFDSSGGSRIRYEDFVQWLLGQPAEPDAAMEKSASVPVPSEDKEEMAASFVPAEGDVAPEDWCGELLDLFSPDDKNPESRRFIDLIDGELSVSADTGGEKWGRRFDPDTPVNPTLTATGSPCQRKTNFVSKVPKDAPIYPQVLDGALCFTLTMGRCGSKKVIRWNGLYDGKGGKFGESDAPPSDCDNFWQYVARGGAAAPDGAPQAGTGAEDRSRIARDVEFNSLANDSEDTFLIALNADGTYSDSKSIERDFRGEKETQTGSYKIVRSLAPGGDHTLILTPTHEKGSGWDQGGGEDFDRSITDGRQRRLILAGDLRTVLLSADSGKSGTFKSKDTVEFL